MIDFLTISFPAYFIYFLVACFFALLLPGLFFTNKLRVDLLSKVTLSLIVGIIFWTLQGLVFGFLHARFLSYVYIVIMGVLFLKYVNYRSLF